jgi:hypothetical protein
MILTVCCSVSALTRDKLKPGSAVLSHKFRTLPSPDHQR